MNINNKLKYLALVFFIALPFTSCVDSGPQVEELPRPELAFSYSVIDDVYQLDYYVGANIQFLSSSEKKGTCLWNFGDGNTAEGETVTHKYAQAGTYDVKLSIDGRELVQKIFICDIRPILSLTIENDLCEVLSTLVSFNIKLPNPEGLSTEYRWIFPEGTIGEDGNSKEEFIGENPGKVKFGNVGSQAVRLQVKLGERQLDEGQLSVPVAYNKEAPTLYYAVKSRNIMAHKLVNDAPEGMKISSFDMGVKSGSHPLNILFHDSLLYVLDCGKQFTYVDDKDGNLGDGRIFVMSKDGSKIENMFVNSGHAYDDPYFGYIENGRLFFTDRNTGIATVGLQERNKSFSRESFPYYVRNDKLGYYTKGLSYGAISACFGRINNTWYWCKTFNGNGIFRFNDSDILTDPVAQGHEEPIPSVGVALESMSPKSFVWDAKNGLIYFTIYDSGYEGLYRCTLEQLNEVGAQKTKLAPYKLKLANGKKVALITEPGKGEGGSGEFIGICQLALDETDGSVYFGLRSGDPDVNSGLMRYNPATGHIEYLLENIEVYGVAINKKKSKLF